MSCLFEKIEKSIVPLKEKKFLLAVSGGIDSMCMLHAFSRLALLHNIEYAVVTVNHNIRPSEETAADITLVKNFCAEKGATCFVEEISREEFLAAADERGRGTEDAARFLRYQRFESICERTGSDIVCLAHNENDRLETLLQRFLQGATGVSQLGMTEWRGKYFRPMLSISRSEIEMYASENSVKYLTDSTNADDAYLRNNIRLNLIPLLDEKFPDWKKSVLASQDFKAEEISFFTERVESLNWFVDKKNHEASIDKKEFIDAKNSVRVESIKNVLAELKSTRRISNQVLKDFSINLKKIKTAEFVFCTERDKVFIKKRAETRKNLSFFAIIKDESRDYYFSHYEEDEKD